MHHFAYRDGILFAEDVDLIRLADRVGTPFYCYSTATLERHYKVFAQAFADAPALVCYALKANSNQAVVATLARLGAGADIVSGGELKRALAAGVPPGKIVFSGVGKTRDEISAALDAGIFCFNVESEAELDAVSEVAATSKRVAPVSVRVNPDIDAKTHAKISTGHAESKQGIPTAPAPGRCPASASLASTCTSAARSPTSILTTMPRPSSPSSPATCCARAIAWSTWTSAAASASPTA